MLAYEGAQILDITGPLEVFSAATQCLRDVGAPASAGYDCMLVAAKVGPVAMSSGLELVAQKSLSERAGKGSPPDTLMVPGGTGTREAALLPAHMSWIKANAPRARRIASVCTGTFLLAQAGLLDGRRVTTHWNACDELARLFPALSVDPEPIFVKDGNVYTSAGITAGMDLALALVEEDYGRKIALAVAQRLVMFLKRPGGQSQFSAQLGAQLAERDALRELQSYIADNPAADLCVEALAARSAMSPRHFARVFRAEVGSTPARFVEMTRIEVARRWLEESQGGVESIASASGFGSGETMRRAFLRHLRVGPADYRNRFRSHASLLDKEHPKHQTKEKTA